MAAAVAAAAAGAALCPAAACPAVACPAGAAAAAEAAAPAAAAPAAVAARAAWDAAAGLAAACRQAVGVPAAGGPSAATCCCCCCCCCCCGSWAAGCCCGATPLGVCVRACGMQDLAVDARARQGLPQHSAQRSCAFPLGSRGAQEAWRRGGVLAATALQIYSQADLQGGRRLRLPLLLQLRHDLPCVLLLLRGAVLQHVLQLLLLAARMDESLAWPCSWCCAWRASTTTHMHVRHCLGGSMPRSITAHCRHPICSSRRSMWFCS